MTRRQDLQDHHHNLREIIKILDAMKMLAYMETHKLSTFLDAQHRVFDAISTATNDFLSFYPEMKPKESQVTPVYLLIGSERGFCGDFNQELAKYHIEQSLNLSLKPILIIVGRKLYNLIQDDVEVYAQLDGPNVVEEVPTVLDKLVQVLSKLQQQQPLMSLYSVYHSGEQGIITKRLLPPFQQQPQQSPRFQYPPELNLSPTDFLFDVAEQYLFAALHKLLYSSLLEENHNRIMHLEGAVKHLENIADELTQQCNILRREEITEEIEVILLNVGAVDLSNEN
ncbi:ATP synthase gamma subunit [Vibrio sp. B1FLJ16]|uniref:F0F1 ATP synthase subunit gamma n=1 Tax=Vibrio sp. B1FLJ16 TaxID=2751178 RepID=UPI0015F5A59F|nr:FoF1 ATP synthase subunit gamma [Vibrio sp. B1FLJ16]CAD7820023.1 ATP synthase gamma subunit [Vibrio sp. B1FLJ16]CAE6941480.1 ATP synthase gamma subunit [Vibrio sp. B1FLJ16]